MRGRKRGREGKNWRRKKPPNKKLFRWYYYNWKASSSTKINLLLFFSLLRISIFRTESKQHKSIKRYPQFFFLLSLKYVKRKCVETMSVRKWNSLFFLFRVEGYREKRRKHRKCWLVHLYNTANRIHHHPSISMIDDPWKRRYAVNYTD